MDFSSGTTHVPVWLDRADHPAPFSPVAGHTSADLAIIGGGYTGLWTALIAKETDPDLDVLIVEKDTCGSGASGRNGGMCSPNLTHGLTNGHRRWPHEMGTLLRQGHQNLDELQRALDEYGIDCGFTRSGKLTIARTPWQVETLEQEVRLGERLGERADFLGPSDVGSYLDSPAALAGVYQPDYALVDPARLAWGLRDACVRLGVRVAEGTVVTGLDTGKTGGVGLHTRHGHVRARRVALATNASTTLLRRLRRRVLPVYDYALATEPLTDEQLSSINWVGPHGCTDAANQFHYFRKTADNRILWGGYDAVYHYGGKTAESLTRRPGTFATLARNFQRTFPTLADVTFTHSWGGIIDMSSSFSLFAGTVAQGRVAYVAGYTGLGVAATRFGAQVMLDLLAGRRTARTELSMIRRQPTPLPPEPLRWLGVTVTRRALAREDATGRRNAWLRALDRVGVGFGS